MRRPLSLDPPQKTLPFDAGTAVHVFVVPTAIRRRLITIVGARTGEIEANLLRLNEHFGFSFLDELIARKTAEDALTADLDWSPI